MTMRSLLYRLPAIAILLLVIVNGCGHLLLQSVTALESISISTKIYGKEETEKEVLVKKVIALREIFERLKPVLPSLPKELRTKIEKILNLSKEDIEAMSIAELEHLVNMSISILREIRIRVKTLPGMVSVNASVYVETVKKIIVERLKTLAARLNITINITAIEKAKSLKELRLAIKEIRKKVRERIAEKFAERIAKDLEKFFKAAEEGDVEGISLGVNVSEKALKVLEKVVELLKKVNASVKAIEAIEKARAKIEAAKEVFGNIKAFLEVKGVKIKELKKLKKEEIKKLFRKRAHHGVIAALDALIRQVERLIMLAEDLKTTAEQLNKTEYIPLVENISVNLSVIHDELVTLRDMIINGNISLADAFIKLMELRARVIVLRVQLMIIAEKIVGKEFSEYLELHEEYTELYQKLEKINTTFYELLPVIENVSEKLNISDKVELLKELIAKAFELLSIAEEAIAVGNYSEAEKVLEAVEELIDEAEDLLEGLLAVISEETGFDFEEFREEIRELMAKSEWLLKIATMLNKSEIIEMFKELKENISVKLDELRKAIQEGNISKAKAIAEEIKEMINETISKAIEIIKENLLEELSEIESIIDELKNKTDEYLNTAESLDLEKAVEALEEIKEKLEELKEDIKDIEEELSKLIEKEELFDACKELMKLEYKLTRVLTSINISLHLVNVSLSLYVNISSVVETIESLLESLPEPARKQFEHELKRLLKMLETTIDKLFENIKKLRVSQAMMFIRRLEEIYHDLLELLEQIEEQIGSPPVSALAIAITVSQ